MKKVIGIDLGDKRHSVVILDEEGNEAGTATVSNTAAAVEKFFAPYGGAVAVLEAGTHSLWISRLLESLGLEVCVGNPRKMQAIWDADDKSDERDARMMALMYRLSPRLLHPVRRRGEQSQAHLQLLKSRNVLVEARTKLINHARGAVKAVGGRLPSCSGDSFHKKAVEAVPAILAPAMEAVFQAIMKLSEEIKNLDRAIRKLCEETYPETAHLTQIDGVGDVTALAFVLTLEDPARFAKSRQVGPYLGMTPRRDQSGENDKQLPITKAGNGYLRQVLVNCAHYILGPFGPDCDLRRAGERIARGGGKNAKKRAIVAVARKLAVLMHRLWTTKDTYKRVMNETPPVKSKPRTKAAPRKKENKNHKRNRNEASKKQNRSRKRVAKKHNRAA